MTKDRVANTAMRSDAPATGPLRGATGAVRRLLITAGPTHEPIDAVRFLGNRSSGRLGIRLAEAAAARGWHVTLLLGPTALTATDSRVLTERFRTAADLQALLRQHFPGGPGVEAGGAVDVLVMAAAVADYRPARIGGVPVGTDPGGKRRRSASGMVIELEPTEDLLAECAARRVPGQVVVGFALEPRESLMESARDKLARKRVDLIVANPLETMDSPSIEAVVIGADGAERRTKGAVPKDEFAGWLLDVIEATLAGRAPAAR